MQGFDWNDLKYILAVSRFGSLVEAARRLGVSDTTVARRVKRLERKLGTPLFVADAHGRHTLTEAGQRVLPRA